MTEARTVVVHLLQRQAEYCTLLDSSLYALLLERAAEDARSGGPVWRLLEEHAADPEGSALALRLMGAVHRLVLEGEAPRLAGHYPSAGGSADDVNAASDAFLEVVEEHHDAIRPLLERTVQTNEVGRAGALIGGFLTVAERTGLPLRILELGASAGLLLRWDRFLYEERGATWGPHDSPVRLCDFNSEVRLPFHVSAHVAERRGCDKSPVDPVSSEGAQTLLSYVWADQIGRMRNLRAALQVAAAQPAKVERAGAGEWIGRQLAEPRPGIATVVYHSIVLQYLSEDERTSVIRTITEAGRNATATAPLAWLYMEPAGDVANVDLTLWPGGEERLVATSGYHGAAVRWLGYR